MSEANATVQTTETVQLASYAEFCTAIEASVPWFGSQPYYRKQMLYAEYATDGNGGMSVEEWADGAAEYGTIDAWLDTAAASACSLDGDALVEFTIAHLDGLEQWVKDHADQFGSPPPVPATVPQTPEQVAAQQKAEQAAKQAAIDGHRAAALKALDMSSKAVRKAEKGLAVGMLQAGKYALACLRHFQAATQSRATSVNALEREWTRWGENIDCNAVVQAYAAYRELAELPGVKAEVPWTTWKNAWRQLVVRGEDKDGLEQWSLLPGLEQECRAEYKRVVELAERDATATSAAVRTLVERGQALKAEAAKLAAAAKQAADTAAKAELDAARIAEAKAEQDAKAAKQAAADAKDAEKAELTRVAEDAKERLRQSQTDLVAKHAAATAATAEKDRADKAAAEAERLRQVAADKALKAAKAATETPKPAGATAKPGVAVEQPVCKAPTVDPTAVGKAGSPADIAKLASEFLLANEDNEGAVVALVALLRGKLSARMDAALEAFGTAYQAFQVPSKPGSKPVVLTAAEQSKIAKHNAKLATARAG